MTTEAQALAFAKRVSSREVESPLSKAEWIALIEAQAEANADPSLSKARNFAKYLDTEIGKELFWASKAAPNDGAASALDRQEAFVTKAAAYLGSNNYTLEPLAYAKARAEMDGPASAKMHSLAVDRMRETGHTYERAYSHVYGHENNQGLREQVKAEHMQATLSGGAVGYADSYRNPHPGGSGPRP